MVLGQDCAPLNLHGHKNWNLLQWILDLSFFKGVEKTNDECAKTTNPQNNFFNKKKS
jgi:hypothetical protein